MRATAIVLVLVLSGMAEAAFAATGQRSTGASERQDDLSAVVQSATEEAAAWRQVAEAIPLGSKVKVQTTEGRRLNGTLMRVDGTAIMLKRNTRRPEPALTVAFTDIGKLERDQGTGGANIAKAIGVGLAAGAGVFFSLILIALQMD